MTQEQKEKIQAHCREAYEIEAMHSSTHGRPEHEAIALMAGPLTVYEKYQRHVSQDTALNYRGAELDVWLDTWAECRKFHWDWVIREKPLYYMGRFAGRNAYDGHVDQDVDLRGYGMIDMAYDFTLQMEREDESFLGQLLPDSFFDLKLDQRREFLRGYYEALAEAEKKDQIPA